jgi:hypothetical protein
MPIARRVATTIAARKLRMKYCLGCSKTDSRKTEPRQASEVARAARERDLELLHGPPPWSVLAVPSGSSAEFARSIRELIES